jgi:predicted ATPase
MHIDKVTFHPHAYPQRKTYPFNLDIFSNTESLRFETNITFFIGENGTGKSTLLKAITRRCGIHIWTESDRSRFDRNPYEEELYRYIDVEWANGKKPGAYFSSETYQHMTQIIDEWACSDPKLLAYFGGKSLVSQSHGESFMSFFKSRYKIEGIYFLDEPETALSPKRQIEFLNLLTDLSGDGHAQFVIATHSPILLSCPNSLIVSFDHAKLHKIAYEKTDYYLIYRDFLLHRDKYLAERK